MLRHAFVLLGCLILVAAAQAAEEGLVARYDFEEGTGAVVHDRSGLGHDGKIVGAAAWEKGDFGTALRCNSADSYVDCGSPAALDISAGGSFALWVKLAEPLQGGLVSWATGGGWNDERLVLAFNTYHGAPQLLAVMADGKGCGSERLNSPPPDRWTHLALTFNGRNLRLYVDGVLAHAAAQPLRPDLRGVPLQLGRCQGLGQQILNGLLDEVAIYNRPLSDLEIVSMYKAEAARRGQDLTAFSRPTLAVTAHAFTGRLQVEATFGLMRPLPDGARLTISVARPKAPRPLASRTVPLIPDKPMQRVVLDLQQEAPGAMVVTARLADVGGKPIGQETQANVAWPKRDPRFSAERSVTVLNNMCFELLNAPKPGTKTHTVHNPREGWLFFSLPATQIKPPAIVLDGQKVAPRRVGDNWEAMRFVAEGPHRVALTDASATRLIVRAVGELVYAMYGANPLVPETGKYTWEWLRKHCLDHYNTVIGPASMDFAPEELKEWTAEGGQWMTQRGLPWDMTVEEVVDYWTKEPGFAHPAMSGIWADEFGGGEKMQQMYPIWCEALKRIRANPQHDGKRFYAFTGATYIADYELLTKTLMECGYRIGAEWYVREVPTEEDIEGAFGPQWERNQRAAWDKAAPEAAMDRLWVFGLLSQPEESCDIYPQCDYNVFLDKQVQFIATDPALFGVRGMYGYYSPYVGEEQTRLFARLVRHYALEGNTQPLLPDPYMLTHIQNPDFTDGLNGWQVSAAAEGSVAPKNVARFGFLQGRYATNVGDTTVWTRRSADKPNVLSQQVRGLQPGRLYSLRFFTGNYQDYEAGKSNPYQHGVSARLEGVQLVPDKCFQAVIKSNYAHTYGPFNSKNPYRMNYHQIVFRPAGTTATLTLSDWQAPTEPGGPAGEEFIWNFIQLQPYFGE